MNTVPWGEGRPPAPSGPVPAVSPVVQEPRRLVAVAVTEAEVLRTESDLWHVAGAAGEVDVLIARQDPPAGPIATDLPDDDEDDDGDRVEGGTPVAGGAGLRVHRLGLRWTVQDRDEPDLVAAMSELVGFDPEDQVFCVAPQSGPEPVTDPELVVVRRAVRRVARVYGLPVLHYRPVRDGADPARELAGPPAVCGSA